MVLSLFATRLFQLQGLEAEAYATSAAKARLRTVELPARRGTITDRRGVPLATSVDAVDIVADPTLLREEDRWPAAQVIGAILGVGAVDVLPRLSGERRFSYVAKRVTPEVARRVLDATLPGSDATIPGLFGRATSERTYPAGDVGGNVIGFVGADGRGLGGLEYALDGELAGRDGWRTYEQSRGRPIPLAHSAGREPAPGRDVRLTIDRDIQWTAQRAIARAVRDTKSESGTVVVLDPRTGRLHALATVPSLDPSRAADPDAERGNRPLSEAYEPGSTGKVLTAAALIEEGAVTPRTKFTVPNRLRRADKSFKDWREHATEQLTYAGTLARSSNIGTILAAERLGFDELYPYFRAFGIGEPTGIDFPGETAGALPKPDTWSSTTGYTLSFGQGYSVNAVQMASAIGTIANGGVRVPPVLVEGWTDDGGTFRPTPRGEPRRVVSERTARTVSRMLEAVVGEDGTAPAAAIPGYRVAGKTGTAQRYDSRCGGYCGFTMSFIGFAPADAPQLVVAVTLQKPRNGIGGGFNAGPVFREVTAFALETLRIPPTGSRPPAVRVEWGG